MAFSSAILFSMGPSQVVGARKMTYGSYTSDGGSTGGDIDTGLKVVESITLQKAGSAVGANANSVNETLPADGDAITIVTDADETGYWIAYGY